MLGILYVAFKNKVLIFYVLKFYKLAQQFAKKNSAANEVV